jgi:hypothetical protein
LPATLRDDEELAKQNEIRYRSVVSLQPLSHPSLKLGDIHGVSMPLISDELEVELRQERWIGWGAEPVVHPGIL